MERTDGAAGWIESTKGGRNMVEGEEWIRISMDGEDSW